MSNENSQSFQQQQYQQSSSHAQSQIITPNDCLKLLDSLFQRDNPARNIDLAFELFEKNFSKFLDYVCFNF